MEHKKIREDLEEKKKHDQIKLEVSEKMCFFWVNWLFKLLKLKWHQTLLQKQLLLKHCSLNTYKSWSLPAVPWLNIQRHFEQVVRKLLLSPVAHRVQVLEESLCNNKNDMFWVQDLWNILKDQRENDKNERSPWYRAQPSDSRAGSDTAGSRLWFRPLSSFCWSWSAPCRDVWGSLGYLPLSSGC